MNGLRFLYALLPFFVRRFLYAVSNASIIGVTGSSLSGLDRYSNRMPFSLNFRSNLMKEEVSRLIRTGNTDIKKYFHLASPSDAVRKPLNFQTISMLSRS